MKNKSKSNHKYSSLRNQTENKIIKIPEVSEEIENSEDISKYDRFYEVIVRR